MKTLLIVDDDENIRLLLRDEFCDRGYNIITAVDGEEALVSFDEAVVDLVILDIVMPKLGGMEVLAELKKRSREIPVILYTGNPEKAQDRTGWDRVDLVQKSGNLTELVGAVESFANV